MAQHDASNPTPSGEQEVSFKDTLNLPRTDFPIRANAKVDDPLMLERWLKEDLYNKAFALNKGKEKFILHDGPPYANGNLHLGHAYNNTLKDIVTKMQRMQGKNVPVIPGWDCHGLPIEQKVRQEFPDLSGGPLRTACRAYAAKWVEVQKMERRNLGVVMDWDHPYITMDPEYEANIMRAFGIFVAKGYIEKKLKTVPWCPTDQTVLAIAEIEYQDRKDPSIYVQFPLEASAVAKVAPALQGKEVSLLVWTTTPWTLPLNRAVLLNPKADYVVLEHTNGAYFIVAKDLADKICSMMGIEKKVIAEFPSSALAGLKAQHPFIDGLTVPILLEQMVALEDGTACVHSAPGCGPEDYEVGVRNNLEIFSPLSADGKYTVGIEPKELEGMPVADGQIWVIKALAAKNHLLFKTSIKHPYPHCWRCRNGLIFRATSQWFCNLEKNNLKQKAVACVDGIHMVPEASGNRLKATMEGRLEWCLSRQRTWGVPIPALACTGCDYTFTSPEFIEKVAQQVAKEGIEYWDRVDVKELLPAGLKCSSCNSATFKKEQDILDVWFESGVSHYAVLQKNPALAFPADIYLEGKDQHRAWFQSSLLTALVIDDKAPMKSIVTHGFTVDDQGRKMSKSLGNVMLPAQMIEKLGTDGLRLWGAGIDLGGEAIVSEILIRNVQEVFRKIRNTCRFLLSNLYDFAEKDLLPLDKLQPIDRLALERLCVVDKEIRASYDSYDFTSVSHKLADYCSVDLSAYYMDISKDRLYTDGADSQMRRSAQTAYFYIVDTLTKLMAPILSFTAEQVSDQYQKDKKVSIHLQNFADLSLLHKALVTSNTEQRATQLKLLSDMRSALLKAIEVQREQGIIKHPLETRITLFIDDTQLQNVALVRDFIKEVEAAGQTFDAFVKEWLVASQVILAQSADGLEQSQLSGFYVKVEHALGDKCPRCWQWEESTHPYKLCKRCQSVVGK